MTYQESPRCIAVEAIQNWGDINVDDISILKDLLGIGDTMARLILVQIWEREGDLGGISQLCAERSMCP